MYEVKESKDFVKLLLLIRQLYVEWDQKIRNYFKILKGTEETHSDRTGGPVNQSTPHFGKRCGYQKGLVKEGLGKQ